MDHPRQEILGSAVEVDLADIVARIVLDRVVLKYLPLPPSKHTLELCLIK
jgi:hypothetical protein